MELKYIVYVTVNLCNGKLYFGVHRTNPEVFDGYIGNSIYSDKQAVLDLPFHKAVRKYGYKNFKRTTIQVFPNTEEGKQQAYNLESLIVNSTLLRSKNVYNVTHGGIGGTTGPLKKVYKFTLKGEYLRSYKSITDAALDLNINSNLCVMVKDIRNNCLGATYSAYGFYWSYVKKFNYHTCRKKIAQYTLNGKFLRYFDSISEAEYLLSINTIHQALSKNYPSGGYQWRYYSGNDNDIDPYYSMYTKNEIIPIKMLNKNNELIKIYDSVNQCAKENNLSSSQINRVLKNVIKSHKGFKFKYV